MNNRTARLIDNRPHAAYQASLNRAQAFRGGLSRRGLGHGGKLNAALVLSVAASSRLVRE
jgi:hypothetical protein